MSRQEKAIREQKKSQNCVINNLLLALSIALGKSNSSLGRRGGASKLSSNPGFGHDRLALLASLWLRWVPSGREEGGELRARSDHP